MLESDTRKSDAAALFGSYRKNYWRINKAGYQEKLSDAIKHELEDDGFCRLLDDLLLKKWDIICSEEWDVLVELYKSYKRKGLANDLRPYLMPVKYSKSEICMSEDIYRLIEDLRYLGQEAHLQHSQQVAIIKNSQFNQAKEKLTEIVQKNETLTTQVYRLKRELESQKDQNQTGKEQYEIAQTTIFRLNARIKELEVQKESEETARKKAEEDRNRLEAAAESQARARADELTRTYLEENRRAFRQETDRAVEGYVKDRMNRSGSLADAQQRMKETTNQYQVEWIRSMDELRRQFDDQVNQAKSEFYDHLHEWQKALYQQKLEPLAASYRELYQILNVDRLIDMQVLFQSNSTWEGQIPAAAPAGAAPEVLEKLKKLNNTLNTYLRRLETALNSLDLYAYYPQSGTEFDEIWHTSETDLEPGKKYVVNGCVTPGVAKRIHDDRGDDVVLRAVVKVKEQEDKHEVFAV